MNQIGSINPINSRKLKILKFPILVTVTKYIQKIVPI